VKFRCWFVIINQSFVWVVVLACLIFVLSALSFLDFEVLLFD